MKFALLVALAACGRLGFGDMPGDGNNAGSDGGGIDAMVPPFQPYWTSGTRFRARLWVVGDGSDPIFENWRDTQLDTDCQSSTAADGADRCLPAHVRADQYYADSGCTQRLAWGYASPCGHDAYAFFPDVSNAYHEVPIGAVYSGPVYTPNPCTLASAPSTRGPLYSTGAEVPPTTFAATHYSNKVVGNYTHFFAGFGDGSSLDLGFLGVGNGSCHPDGGIRTGTARCMPNGDAVLVPVYSDSGCMQRAYYSASGAMPSEFVVDNTALCGPAYDVYQVTANVTAASYWTLDPTNGCAMQTTGTGTLFTATLNDPYPTGTVAPGPRRGRLGKLYWTGDDGVQIELSVWDEDLGRSCNPFIAQDGAFRCLPKEGKPVTAIPDATCSGTTSTVVGNCYAIDPVAGPSYQSCDDGPFTVHTILPLLAASYDDEATCTSLGGAYDENTETGTLPASMFAPLTEMIE